jgi:hypothetical protein
VEKPKLPKENISVHISEGGTKREVLEEVKNKPVMNGNKTSHKSEGSASDSDVEVKNDVKKDNDSDSIDVSVIEEDMNLEDLMRQKVISL